MGVAVGVAVGVGGTGVGVGVGVTVGVAVAVALGVGVGVSTVTVLGNPAVVNPFGVMPGINPLLVTVAETLKVPAEVYACVPWKA
ncbi:MAG: hypothetical protein HY686_06910, partial [Chloroflexi bacterium]|nr:hypothetical protein [Chloroflexota bacterium]